MQTAPSKISQIKTAGERIEKENAKPGFTIMDLVDALDWNSPQDKFYIQSTMTVLVRKGKAYKRTHSKPAVYTFQKEAKAPPKQSNQKARQMTVQPDHKRLPAVDLSDASVDDFERIGITPDMLGKAVFRVYRALQRQVIDLEDELAQTKRKLDDANKRISEQNAMIERHNQTITGRGLGQEMHGAHTHKNKTPNRPVIPRKLKQPTIVRVRKQG